MREMGGEHQREALGVFQDGVLRRPQQFLVQQEGDAGAEPPPGQFGVDLVEQAHILVREGGAAAGFTFADVVVLVRQPYMQVVHLRVGPGVVRHALHKGPAGGGVGIAQVGVGGHALPELPPAVHLGQQRALRAGGGGQLGAHMLKADGLAGPAVARPVVQQAPPRNGLVDLAVHPLHLLPGMGLGGQQGIVFMEVPVLQEGLRLQMLHKKAVAADLGQPVDKVQDVFQAVGTLDADPPMAAGGGFLQVGAQVLRPQGGHRLVPAPGHQEAAPQVVQQPVGPQQHRAGVAAGDGDAPRPGLHVEPVVQGGVPPGGGVRRGLYVQFHFDRRRRAGQHPRQVAGKLFPGVEHGRLRPRGREGQLYHSEDSFSYIVGPRQRGRGWRTEGLPV